MLEKNPTEIVLCYVEILKLVFALRMANTYLDFREGYFVGPMVYRPIFLSKWLIPKNAQINLTTSKKLVKKWKKRQIHDHGDRHNFVTLGGKCER